MMNIIIFGGVQMGEPQRKFTKEFKIEAIRLIVEEGRRISELSGDLGVAENLLRCWKRKSEEGKRAIPRQGRSESRRCRVASVETRELTSAHGARHIKKSGGYLLGGTSMKYVFVRDNREAFPVSLMCRSLGGGRSGFYAWLKRPESPRS